MMTTNKLTKILSGVATLGIAAAMATPAQASSFTVPLNGTGNGFVNTTIPANVKLFCICLVLRLRSWFRDFD
ncbi:MAG: hypothetical protein ACKO90_09075 [Microcystis panniformis]